MLYIYSPRFDSGGKVMYHHRPLALSMQICVWLSISYSTAKFMLVGMPLVTSFLWQQSLTVK